MAAKAKFQVVYGTNRGTESCDYRGANFIGDAQGDHHSTIRTVVLTDDVAIETALVEGVQINQQLNKYFGGLPVFIRFGIFDNN